MAIADVLLPEFDHESAVTRSLLALVPEDQADWAPHPRSMTFGQLAMHLAGIPDWAAVTLSTTEFDVQPPDGDGYRERPFESMAATLAAFDQSTAAARNAIAAASDEAMQVPWTLLNRGATVLTLPRVKVLRYFVISHLVHHRGQLTVYLRLHEVALPPIYGPTGDTPV